MAHPEHLNRVRERGGKKRQGVTTLAAAQEGSQHAVDHRSQPCQSAPLGQLHGGTHRGRSRHPIAGDQLVEPQMQQPAQLGRLTLRRHLAQLIQPSIEQTPLANGAVGQLRGQSPIERCQLHPPQLPLQRSIGVSPCRHSLQHLPGQLPRSQSSGFSHGCSSRRSAQAARGSNVVPQLAPGGSQR